MDVQDELDSTLRAIEIIGRVSEKQPPLSIVVQTPDGIQHKITYSHVEDTDTFVYDVSNVDETYADVVTNAIVRHATSYDNIDGVNFVKEGQLDVSVFDEARDEIFERWGVDDNKISDEMKDSVPSRGYLFAPRTPHGSLKKLANMHQILTTSMLTPGMHELPVI